MKIIEVPKPIEALTPVRNNLGQTGEIKEEVAFKTFLVLHCDNYGEAGKSIAMLRQLNKIVAVIEACDGTLSLEDADYAFVKAACERPQFIPRVARQLLAFNDAVEKAQEVKAP